MQPIVLDPRKPQSLEDVSGAIIAEEVRVDGKRLFRKGEVLTADRAADLHLLDRPVHAVLLQAGEVHEDAAARQLADAIAGPGTLTRGPLLSRVNVKAERKGLLRVDRDAVMAMNLIRDMAIFTQIDRLAVLPGKTLAGVKITPIATHENNLRDASAIASETTVIQVKPFLPLRVGVFSTEGMNDSSKQRFRDSVSAKISWYGGTVVDIVDVDREVEAVVEVMTRYQHQQVDLILAGGGNTIDPLDPTLLALQRLDAEMVAFGAPLHPGSMLWLANWKSLPVFNLASCSMYSRSTSADLILPWIMAGERVHAEDVAGLGYGGLLDNDMQFRFPPYDAGEPTDGAED
ncbi:MAG: hypothetical protein AB7G88_09335 [Thermomicrobiales bacterium]